MNHSSRVQDVEPSVVVNLPPNSSKLFLDSTMRDKHKDSDATDFEATLSTSGSGLKRISHRTLQWMQPLYTHNLNNWQLIMTFGPGFAQRYVYYMTPFVMFKEFSKPSQPYGFAAPDAHSYAAMVEACLQTGARKIESPGTVEAAQPGASLEFRYSVDRGFVMYSTAGPPRVQFTIEPCSWMQRANNVHGFGVRENVNNSVITMNPSAYANATSIYFSDLSPSLVTSRYIAISSREICRNRKITSFNNTSNPALAAIELNIIPVVRDTLGVLHTYTAEADPTVINLRYGDNIQFLRISMSDEFGEGMPTGSPLDGAIYAGLDPGEAIPLMLQSDSMYSNDLIDLILGNPLFFQPFANVKLPDSPIVHVFETTMI